MSFLRSKSECNQQAANLLFEQNLHASSVHCSYYRCLQGIKDKLITVYEYSEKELNRKMEKGNSHNILINYIKAELINSKKFSLSQKFSIRIGTLKGKRVDADYYDKEANATISKASILLADEIIKLLNDHIKKKT